VPRSTPRAPAASGHARRRAPAERQPAGERDLFRILVEGVREYAIVLLDPAGTVVTWNPGAERIEGYSSGEIVGRDFSILFPPEDVAAGRPALALREAGELGTYEQEGWRLRKDGSRFWASAVITAIRDPAGRLTGFAKVTRDLTERRRAAEARRNLAEAREALRARDDFLAIASHELRTPLTSLRLLVDALSRSLRAGEAVSPAQAERLAQLSRLVARFGDLVANMMDAAAMASGHVELQRSTFDLAGLVEEVVGRWADEARRRGGELQLAAIPISGSWDRARLAEAISGIVGNAVKYAGTTPIQVSVGQEGERAMVAVEDHGPGISLEDQARVFERFERAAPVSHYGGFGLGLWAARQVVAAHGGEIEIRSTPGKGAWFAIRLPPAP